MSLLKSSSGKIYVQEEPRKSEKAIRGLAFPDIKYYSSRIIKCSIGSWKNWNFKGIK